MLHHQTMNSNTNNFCGIDQGAAAKTSFARTEGGDGSGDGPGPGGSHSARAVPPPHAQSVPPPPPLLTATATARGAAHKDQKSDKGQKSDKAVEVHHDGRTLARFRTQTECARYLRATPEAVSYHCSKGGGVCNGLGIRPLSAAAVAALADHGAAGPFGLFDGAPQHRPRERPQLRPAAAAALKTWLLSPEHRDNPYPTQRELRGLMDRTGLDKTQLKHWFNNARKRILKPLQGGRPAGATRRSGGAGKRRRDIAASGGEGGGGAAAPGGRAGAPPNKKSRTGEDGVARADGEDGAANAAAAALGDDDNDAANAANAAAAAPGKVDERRDSMGSASHASPSQLLQEQQLLLHQQRQLFAQRQRQQQLLVEERQRTLPRQFDDPFGRMDDQNADNHHHSRVMGGGRNAAMSQNQYDRRADYLNHSGTMHNNQGMLQLGGMMGFRDPMSGMQNGNSMSGMLNEDSMSGMLNGDSMSGMLNGDSMSGMLNGGGARNSMFNNNGYGGGGNTGYRESRGNNDMGTGGGGFGNVLDVNDSTFPYDRFNDHPQSCRNNNMSNNGGNTNGGGHQGYNQESDGGGHNNNNHNDGNNNTYCQPIHAAPHQGGGSGGGPHAGATAAPSAADGSARSNAVFKQQVATMAMNEATKAFQDMEDAFAHAKGVLAASRTTQRSRRLLRGLEEGGLHSAATDPESEPLVLAAHAHTKKCQGVAMFKLKVSQRASEEAANAYDSYQRMMEGRKGSAGTNGKGNEDSVRTGEFQGVTGR